METNAPDMVAMKLGDREITENEEKGRGEATLT